MTEVEDQVSALRLFNEKVKELLELSFMKAVTDPNAGFSLSGERQEDGSFKMRSTVTGPSVEAVKAFVLTFRFFIQDNETTHFVTLGHCMIQAILTLNKEHTSSLPELELIKCWMLQIS